MEKVREAVGLFSDMKHLQDAVRELETTAFPRHDISVIGTHAQIRSQFGDIEPPAEALEDNSDTPRIPPVRSEEKTIALSAIVGGGAYVGAVALALAAGALSVPGIITAAAIGGGGGAAVGAIVAALLGDHDVHNISEQISNGGLLLWVRTPDPEREDIACSILRAHGAEHVHVHEIDAKPIAA